MGSIDATTLVWTLDLVTASKLPPGDLEVLGFGTEGVLVVSTIEDEEVDMAVVDRDGSSDVIWYVLVGNGCSDDDFDAADTGCNIMDDVDDGNDVVRAAEDAMNDDGLDAEGVIPMKTSTGVEEAITRVTISSSFLLSEENEEDILVVTGKTIWETDSLAAVLVWESDALEVAELVNEGVWQSFPWQEDIDGVSIDDFATVLYIELGFTKSTVKKTGKK